MFGPASDEKALRFRSWPCALCRQIASPISYLISCQSADSTFRASSFDVKVIKELGWLRSWLATCSHNHKCFRVASLTQGSEHQVDLDLQFGECVIKTTLPGVFGFAPYAVGMTEHGQFVSVQDFASGEPPTQLEVNNFLKESGLIAVREDMWLWKKDDETRPVSIWVGDARADNFVSHKGNIIPIDLRLWITRR